MTDGLREALNHLRAFFRKESPDSDLDGEMANHLESPPKKPPAGYANGRSAPQSADPLRRCTTSERAPPGSARTAGPGDLDAGLALRFSHVVSGWHVYADRDAVLALGIGANVTIFSVVNTTLRRPLLFSDPRRLVWIEGPPREAGLSSVTYSVDAFEEYQQRNHSLGGVTAYEPFYGPSDYKLNSRFRV